MGHSIPGIEDTLSPKNNFFGSPRGGFIVSVGVSFSLTKKAVFKILLENFEENTRIYCTLNG